MALTRITAELLLQPEQHVEHVLPEIFPRKTCLILAGKPGCGKSTLCYTLGMAIATGMPILGWHPPEPQSVLYFDQENSYHDALAYLRRAWRGLECPSVELVTANFHWGHLALGDRRWHETASFLISQCLPAAIFYDTATHCFGIEDENSNAEASRNMGAVRRLGNLSEACSIVLKHERLGHAQQPGNHEQTIRGAKDWLGSADGVLFLSTQRGRPLANGLHASTLTPSKTRAYGLQKTLVCEPFLSQNAGLSFRRRNAAIDSGLAIQKTH